jgi:hypothetical protein
MRSMRDRTGIKNVVLEEAVLDVKEVRLLDHEIILSCNHTFLQPHKGGRITFRHIKSLI